MPENKFLSCLKTTPFKSIVTIFAILLAGGTAVAAQERAIHSFGNRADGNAVYGGVISDSVGNLYGTTHGGGTFPAGAYGAGVVFELLRQADGSWTEQILHDFGQGTDGRGPTAGLVFDGAGNLYGATYYGGGTNCQGGCGIVFQLQPPTTQGGTWTEVVLYRFSTASNGLNPHGNLIVDTEGNLFGVTQFGGAANLGVLFELAPQGGGVWIEKVIHSFTLGARDGNYPNGLTQDSAGNLYGTTSGGGTHNGGTVLEFSPQVGGGWSEKILHSFNPNNGDGTLPAESVTLGPDGSLYGMTGLGGLYNSGVVFEVTPGADGAWSESVLYSFGGYSADGVDPWGTVVLDSAGNVYGETNLGGTYAEGTVFELIRGSGSWSETLLHNFGSGNDGLFPQGSLIFDHRGNLYGTSVTGGAYFSLTDDGGTVFQIRTK